MKKFILACMALELAFCLAGCELMLEGKPPSPDLETFPDMVDSLDSLVNEIERETFAPLKTESEE